MTTNQSIPLKVLRARLNLTQGDLAARVGVTKQTICAIERGHTLGQKTLAKVSALYPDEATSWTELVHPAYQ